MSQEPNATNAVEQVVSRALRDNLERVQRNSDELHQAIADVVAACSSAKPTNALPPMLRAQTAAASLTAVLEVLTKFVATTLQPGSRSPYEAEIARLAGSVAEPVQAHAPVVATGKPVAPAPKYSAHTQSGKEPPWVFPFFSFYDGEFAPAHRKARRPPA